MIQKMKKVIGNGLRGKHLKIKKGSKKCPECGHFYPKEEIVSHIKTHANDLTQVKQASEGEVNHWRAERKASVYREALLEVCKQMVELLEMEHRF